MTLTALLWMAAVVVAVVFQINVLFTSIYLHRSMSHRSVILSPLPAFVMRFWLWLFAGQAMRSWVAVHRKHHYHSDENGDPHSPHIEGGPWKLFWKHEWRYGAAASDPELLAQYTRGIPKSKWDTLLERGIVGLVTCGLLLITTFAILAANWRTGALLGGAVFAVEFIFYLKAGATVNAFCHWFGYRTFNDNKATNLFWAGWLIAGEGWHNNHHHDLSSPKMSYLRSEFDPSWIFIKALVTLKQAKVLKTINQKEMVERSLQAPR